MKTRQATKWITTLLTLLAFITACSSSNQPLPSPTPVPPTASPTLQPIPDPSPTIDPTSTSLTCLSQPGRVEKGTLESTDPPQEYLIYLPPCYDEQTDQRYPVLYLLHGQTYTDDQWIRLGAVRTLDQLIHDREAQPFLIVFPDDHYWNLEAGPGFGDRLVNALIPYIDQTYRTIPDRDHRAIGGMSRGAGWAIRLGLSHWELFGIIGLHSLAVFKQDGSHVADWLRRIPKDSYPVIFMDIGDNDQELAQAQLVEAQFNRFHVPYEWHLYTGAHTEKYWSAHVPEYIEWYARQWNSP
jgi:enterochelin esterase-like enzyme